MLVLANSLMDGYLLSNAIGKGIVLAQLLGSVVMVAAIIGKWRELSSFAAATRRFLYAFQTGRDVLDYYLTHRPTASMGVEAIYKETCERLFKVLPPEVRARLVERRSISVGNLTRREVELVRGSCEHVLDAEMIRVEGGMSIIATVVALSPMLGLLGTVWGVLDAFADMGSAGSANLATIAPAISSALVTTVVGLLIAIPGVCCHSWLQGKIRDMTSQFEGFADEVMGRIACEFQGKDFD